jgi:hypothetical protein
MISKKILTKFDSQIATLDIIIEYLERAIKLLKSQEIKTNDKINDRNAYIIELAITHYITNNFSSLFNNKGKNLISLERIPIRFEKSFPKNFFFEYITNVKCIKDVHKEDLERIDKNRNLMTAHLSGEEKQLGFDQITTQRINAIFGTKSNAALENKFIFITPTNILKMPILNSVEKIKKILEDINIKRLILQTELN